jgi:class 3 adenylate cyclase
VPGEFLQSLDRETIGDVTLGDNVRKEMTVLFSDIRGFTSLVENMSPGDHIGFINSYLSYMEPRFSPTAVSSTATSAMRSWRCSTGGATAPCKPASTWAAPRPVECRARGAQRVADPDGRRCEYRYSPPWVRSAGPMHIKCTVIGDSVNLAARIESLTKTYGAAQLISHHTRERLADPSRYPCDRSLASPWWASRVPVTLYEILDAEAAPRRAAKLATLAAFERGVDAYYRAEFTRCPVRVRRVSGSVRARHRRTDLPEEVRA